MLSSGFDQKSCDGATSSTNEHGHVGFASEHRGQKSLCHQPPVDFSLLSHHEWTTVQIAGRDRVVLPSICRAPTHHVFPGEGKETGRWHLPPGNYVTPPAEEAASSCSQRDSPSPLPDTRLRRSPALRSHALFPFLVPSSHRPAAQQWRPWAALSRLEENFWGGITKRSVSHGEMTRLWLMSLTPTRRLPAGLALCRHIRQVLCVKISLNTHSREIALSRLCNVSESLAELPHQSRLSGTVISCSS